MRLLLAEDELSLSKAVLTILQKSGYDADAAYDGEEALTCLETGNYDGVILDVMMPKLDGIEVLKALRNRGDQTPVLMLTAKSEVDDKVLGLDNGANDYLTKPFHSKELLARVRAMIRSQPLTGNTMLQAGNIALNRTDFALSSPTGSFRLANREFLMLEMLMQNFRHAISAERFIEKIWSSDKETDAEVVWMYISYLKTKLSALHADVEIASDATGGYALREKSHD